MRPYLKKTLHKKRAGEVAQGIGPEFKPQNHKNDQTNKQMERCSISLVFRKMQIQTIMKFHSVLTGLVKILKCKIPSGGEDPAQVKVQVKSCPRMKEGHLGKQFQKKKWVGTGQARCQEFSCQAHAYNSGYSGGRD
jgi:hypothetical protein